MVVKKLPANAGDARDACSIPAPRRFPGGGHGNPLHYSCLEIPWMEELGGLQSVGLQRVKNNSVQLSIAQNLLSSNILY